MSIYKIKANLLSMLLVLCSISLQSQDLIVTSEGDSLNCKITKIETDNIYFTFKYKEEIRSTLVPLNQVKYHQYKYFQTSVVPADKVVGKKIYPHFRGALNGGWSNRLAKVNENVPADFEQYIKDLKSGYHFGLDINYYFTEQIGVGLKYSLYHSKNEMNNVSVTYPNVTTLYGKMSDNILINFIGPTFSTRFLNGNKKNSLLLNLGMGYMSYKDNATLISDFTLKGNTLGLCWDIGYDIGISENMAIGFQFSYIVGALSQYDISDGSKTQTVKLEKENYESLSRIDLSIGLRFTK